MFPIDPKVACGFWFALMVCATGQYAAPSRGDLLDAAAAARILELAENNDMGVPRRPMSPEIDAVANKPSLLDNLRAEDLAKMTLDDPLLQWAYVCVFTRSMGPFEQLESPLELVLADMRRRGEAVSPMLIKLISENQENMVEFSILGKIEHLDTVRMEPFLQYARNLLRERTKNMSPEAAESAAYVLARHGSKEDEGLIEAAIKDRPFIAPLLIRLLENKKARLELQSVSRTERRNGPSPNAGKDIRQTKDADNLQIKEGSAISHTKPWLIGSLLFIVLLGMYRLLRKSKNSR